MDREYRVGEIFVYEGKVLQCVKDFIEVEELKEGMLFRAENGKLYRLATELKDGEKCSCQTSGYNCSTILRQLCALCPPPLRDRIPREWPHARFVLEDEGREPGGNPDLDVSRHIDIAVDAVEDDRVTFRITGQTHRENDFSVNGSEFESSSGYRLRSEGYPEVGESGGVLFVRGRRDDGDDLKMTASFDIFAKIMEAVTEYNLTNGKGYEKPWPKVGDTYYFVTMSGGISSLPFMDILVDKESQSFGNFFRTRGEAEAARKRVRKALREK